MTSFKSGAGYKGFPSTAPTSGLAYVYGLSDFWSIIFEDAELFEKLLECTTVELADVYSKFLQLTSAISVNDIQTFTHSEIKLVLVDSSAKVEGAPSGTTYKVDSDIVSCKYILDRPMLPVNTLEEGVHFSIDPDASTITFFKSIDSMGFPTRTLPNGDTQISLWMTDVVMDESLVFTYFGSLIDVEPKNVSKVYKDFIKGLYFLYTQGPVIQSLERGLSLSIGIPLARTSEKVLLVVQDENTSNWLVATDKSSYTIPYGIRPDVSEGDELTVGDELVHIAEVKDYQVEDDWWLNISIPPELLPEVDGEEADFVTNLATPGSTADHIMREYLKHHTFLVNLRWEAAFNADSFQEIFDLISESKPTYTYPIFVWTVPIGPDLMVTDDEKFEVLGEMTLFDGFGCGGPYITRDIQKDGERTQLCFIHGNYDPDSIPVGDGVTVSYKVPSSRVFPSGATSFDIDDTDLVPLYNTSREDLVISFREAGIQSMPYILPPVLVVNGVDAVSYYDKVVVREPVPSGFTGITRNSTPLDFPVAESHVYDAFVPDVSDVTSNEVFFVMEVASNVYSVFLYKSGGNTLFDPVYFPTEEEDPIEIVSTDETTTMFTFVDASPTITRSNSGLTVEY